MNKVFLFACLFVLFGCAKQPVIANLNPRLGEQPVGIYSGGLSAAIKGQDARKSAEVVIFKNDQPATRLANVSAPLDIISGKLAAGLRDQGLVIDPSSPVQLKVTIDELLVSVSHEKLLYSAVAKTHIILTVENRGTVFTKVFKREANKDSATRPDLPDLEGMLNTQLSDIIQLVIQDEEIRRLIRRK
ncbi:MAG: YajG family lipoprotein [Pseudomonadota bacterium]